MFHWMRLCLLVLAACGAREALAVGELHGPWPFYWQQLLTPEDIAAGRGQITGNVDLNTEWSDIKTPGVERHGYATYQLTFQAESTAPLTIRFPRFRPAAKVWVNQDLAFTMGELSTEGREAKTRQRIAFHTFTPIQGTNTITIQISNHAYHFHGIFSNVAIGKPEEMNNAYQSQVMRDALTFGANLIMAFYHFYLWWIRRQRLSPLYFGLFCLAVGLRSLVAGDGQIVSLLFNDPPMEWQLKIEYLGIAIPFFSIIMLIHDLYPKEFPRLLTRFWAGLCCIWAVVILLTPATIFPQLLRFYQICILIAGPMVVTALILAAVRRREGAKVFLSGFAMFFAASVLDVLGAMAIIKSPPLAHVGTFALVFFQSILLSRRFDKAFDQAEKAEKEVRILNEGLEQKVKERTDQINIILRNVTSGFLLIDRRGILLPGFTDSCHSLTGTQLEAGKPITEMLPIDLKTKSMLRETIIQVFEDFMPTEVSLSQIPHPIAIGTRMLGISGAVLRDESGKIWAILFTINDVTRLQEAEKAIRYNEMLIGILRERAAFKVFLDDFRKEIQLALEAFQTRNEKAVRNLLHTMKGNLGAFGMRQLAECVHEIESHEQVTRTDITVLSESMERLLDENRTLLNLERKDTTFEVLRSDYEAIISWSAENLDNRLHNELLRMLRRSSQNPIRSYIGPLQNTVERLGQKLEKDVRCLVTGADLHIDERVSGVLRNLIHLVRNAVDHGIEPPELRGDKPQQGTIRVTFSQSEKQLTIVVEDDGRGLSTTSILAKGRAMGLVPANETPSEAAIHRLIFAQGFSTAEEVTDISGRGVGMSAIREAVEELSGTLDIQSSPGRGMTVRIVVPLPEEDLSLVA